MNDIKVRPDSTVFNEFSPKILILQARKMLFYLRSKWIAILVIAIIIGLIPAIYYSFKKATYIAEVTFALDETVAQPSAGTLHSDFGIAGEIGLGSYDAGTIFASMTNIIELMQSRLLIEKTLRKSIVLGNDTLLFADFFLDSLDYRKKWLKNGPRLDFGTSSTKSPHRLLENNIIRSIYSTLIAKNLKVSTKGSTTIILVTCTSTNESFSKYFLEALLEEVTHYYIETKTQRSKNNIATLERRTDSVRTAYNKALYGRASFTDVHLNPSRQIANVSLQKQQTDIQILSTSYVELVRSLETAKTALMRETPLIQYVDMPILPLPVAKPSSIQKFIMFFILGMFLAVAYFTVVKVYKHILNS